ncbi:hypothetical protein N0V86_006689 [Didymella sp. IMI 355093]|nr:hypothetical protein N0V86_006689 [Didymella sp. IMI 355093]
MASFNYMNNTAPFWDFIASLEQQGNNHPLFGQNGQDRSSDNEQGEGREGHHGPRFEGTRSPQFDPWSWGHQFFGGPGGMPHRGPPPPPARPHSPPPPRDHMALLTMTSTRPTMSTTVRRTVRGATTITTMTTVKVHPVQALMAREDTDMVAMPAVAAAVAVTDLGDEEDAVLTTDLVAALAVTTVLHTKDTLAALTVTVVPPTTAGLDSADPGAVADHLQVLVLLERDAASLFAPLWEAFTAQHPSSQDNDTTKKDNEDFTPEVDIFDTPSAYIIHISLPGAKKEDVGVNWDVEKSELSVAGVIYRPGDEEFLKTLAMNERKVGPFEKKIRLGTRANPAHVDAEGITAKLEDGVLRVEVRKEDEGFVEIKKVDIE